MGDVHYYLVYRKRATTRAIRFRDQVGVIIADRKRLPLRRGVPYGVRGVDWQFKKTGPG